MLVVPLDGFLIIAAQIVQGVRSIWIGCRDDPSASSSGLEFVPSQVVWVIPQIAPKDCLGVFTIPIPCNTGRRLAPFAAAIATASTGRKNEGKHHGQARNSPAVAAKNSKKSSSNTLLSSEMRNAHTLLRSQTREELSLVNLRLLHWSKTKSHGRSTCISSFVAKQKVSEVQIELYRAATCCNGLQRTVTYCNVL